MMSSREKAKRDPLADSAGAPGGLALWKRIVFIGIMGLVVLVILEGFGQVYLRVAEGYGGGGFLQYEFDAYKNIHPARGWVDTRGVTHSIEGFRGREGPLGPKEPGNLRIFLMGASTAYGTGGLWPHIDRGFPVLQDDETIDAFLEAMLLERFPERQVEVVNAAIPSVWTHHHLVYLNQDILRREPDMIIFLDGLNDYFYYREDHDQFAGYAYGEQAATIMGPPTVAALTRANVWWLFRRSAFVHVAVRAVERLSGSGADAQNSDDAIDVPRAVESWETVFEQNARRMIERTAAILDLEGVDAIFALQPMLILERERYGYMEEVEKNLFDFNVQATENRYEEYIREVVSRIPEKMEESVENRGFRFIDLTGLFSGSRNQMFTDYAHLTPEANRMVAQRLLEEVLQRGLFSEAVEEEP